MKRGDLVLSRIFFFENYQSVTKNSAFHIQFTLPALEFFLDNTRSRCFMHSISAIYRKFSIRRRTIFFDFFSDVTSDLEVSCRHLAFNFLGAQVSSRAFLRQTSA